MMNKEAELQPDFTVEQLLKKKFITTYTAMYCKRNYLNFLSEIIDIIDLYDGDIKLFRYCGLKTRGQLNRLHAQFKSCTFKPNPYTVGRNVYNSLIKLPQEEILYLCQQVTIWRLELSTRAAKAMNDLRVWAVDLGLLCIITSKSFNVAISTYGEKTRLDLKDLQLRTILLVNEVLDRHR
jgi:hypothetical protein